MAKQSKPTVLRNSLLRFISWFYAFGVWVRNKCFDWGILKQRSHPVPVVVVGNLAVGGTGKTPHVEYLIQLLCHDYNIGVLSRGYRRQTSGFILASSRSTPEIIGDEPYQIYSKFGNKIKVAVCADRNEGITKLLEMHPEINLILLDDAFQHRYVKSDLSIVLMEYNRLPYNDHILPYGRLRESIHGLERASIVVVTKCPDDFKSMDFRIIKKNLDLFPSQGLFFSQYKYGCLQPVFPESLRFHYTLGMLNDKDTILSITGIANPRPFTRYLRTHRAMVKSIRYADHHAFERKDMEFILNKYDSLPGNIKLILTTEKDAVRFASNPYFPEELKPFIFYVPISIDFIPYLNMDFNERIMKELQAINIKKSKME